MPSLASSAAIVFGPPSQPSATRRRRRSQIASASSSGTAVGLLRGRRDLGSSACHPPARHAATNCDTRGWDRP